MNHCVYDCNSYSERMTHCVVIYVSILLSQELDLSLSDHQKPVNYFLSIA